MAKDLVSPQACHCPEIPQTKQSVDSITLSSLSFASFHSPFNLNWNLLSSNFYHNSLFKTWRLNRNLLKTMLQQLIPHNVLKTSPGRLDICILASLLSIPDWKSNSIHEGLKTSIRNQLYQQQSRYTCINFDPSIPN